MMTTPRQMPDPPRRTSGPTGISWIINIIHEIRRCARVCIPRGARLVPALSAGCSPLPRPSPSAVPPHCHGSVERRVPLPSPSCGRPGSPRPPEITVVETDRPDTVDPPPDRAPTRNAGRHSWHATAPGRLAGNATDGFEAATADGFGWLGVRRSRDGGTSARAGPAGRLPSL